MLNDFSDARVVIGKAQRMGLQVRPSTRKNKKYMLVKGNKKIHFGLMGYQDWTKHHDVKRRRAFQSRNKKWKTAPKDTPAYLSYHLLW